MGSIKWNGLYIGLVLLVVMGCPLNGAAQGVFQREYKIGECYKYRLVTEEFHNGKWKSTTIVVNELEVVTDSMGVPHDKVQWVSKEVLTEKDTIKSVTEAAAVAPYLLSLHPKGKIEIPKINVQGMTGAIQDFATFYVAVSPHLGVPALQRQGDSLIRKELVQGNFANGINIIKGDDCFAVKVYLNELTNDRALLITAFEPPKEKHLSYLLDEMNVPVVKDTMNNFQMVLALVNGRYNVQYGKEAFVITSSVKREDGKIERAEMINQLDLKLKVACTAVYEDCQMEMPFVIIRKLTLQVLQ